MSDPVHEHRGRTGNAELVHVLDFLLHHRVPCCVVLELVCERVVLVVLDAPRLKGVDQGGKEKVTDDVLDKLVSVEASVACVVADDKPAGEGCA